MTVAAEDLAFHLGCGRFLISYKLLIRRLLLMTENNKLRKRKSKKPYSSASITTGDIGLNIDHFNRCAGTAEVAAESNTEACGGLTEAKRYVRRYYIRPQNIFCSNKTEIIKALIEIGNKDCSIYTLNNLGDDKDVSKLMNSDIIYYYDDGILYDKNRIKVMDYDLSIKKEEERKHFTNVDNAPDKEFKAEYEDRMTDATELEEDLDDDSLADCPYDVISADYNNTGDEFIVSLNHNVNDIEEAAEKLAAWVEKTYGVSVIDWNTNGSNVFIFTLNPDNAFDMDFDDINVFGEKLTEAKEHICCKCGEPLSGDEHLTDDGLACDGCYLHFYMGG
jgi:hypothetical protein